jgi:hypothetical protein
MTIGGYHFSLAVQGEKEGSEAARLWVIGAFALISLLVTVYAIGNGENTLSPSLYYLIPHLYIIPIILVSLWYPRRGLQVTILLGTSIIALTVFFFYGGNSIDPVLSILNAGIDIWVVAALALLARCRQQASDIPKMKEMMTLPACGRSGGSEPDTYNKDSAHPCPCESIAGYIEALHLKDEGIREGAARALGELQNPEAIEPLVLALSDESRQVREEAARALGKIGGEQAVTPLIRALIDEQRCVREGAVQALGSIGRPAVGPLIETLADNDWHARMGAAISLRIIGDGRATDPIIRCLQDENRFVRREAAKSLGRSGDRRAVAALQDALQDEDEGVRIKAAAALKRIEDGLGKTS